MDNSPAGPDGSHQQLPPKPPSTAAESVHLQPPSKARSEGTPPAKRRRTAPAALSNCCRTCRLRKVKCTGNPGNNEPCSNCARLELVCPFVTASDASAAEKISRVKPSNSLTEAGTLRKRAQRACRQCHSQKTKCSGDLPRCKRCETSGLSCEYTAAKRKFANVRIDAQTSDDTPSPAAPKVATPTPPTRTASLPSKSEQSASPADAGSTGSVTTGNFPLTIDISVLTAQELLARKNFILKHLDAYFENIYWLPCMGFFHPETAYRQVYEGNFDPPTASAVCAIASFFIGSRNAAEEFGMKCSEEVEFFIFRNLHKFSDRVLIPLAINLSFHFLKGSFAKVWQCFGVAARLMTGLQLNWDSSTRNKSFYQQELLRRIAWQIFIMDRLLAGGYEEYISCRAENMKIRLPAHEKAFWGNTPVIAERLSDKSAKCTGIGLHGLNVRIVDLNHRIQAWTKKLATDPSLEPSKVMEDINKFQNELTRFHLSIPDDMRLGDQSIAKYIASPEKAGYVFLHTHLSVGHIDLYRYALPGMLDHKKTDILRRLPPDFVVRSKKQAVAHSLCTGRFCKAIQDEADRLPATGKPYLAGDCTIPDIATQSLRVFIIAMQHKIYDDLTEDTTAPLWRFKAPDESYIRSLIEDGLFRVSAPWSPLLKTCEQVDKSNHAMYDEFNKAQKFADQSGSLGLVGPKVTRVATSLPDPHYILEHANFGVVEHEKWTRAADAAAADRWFRGPAQPNEPSPYTPPEADFDSEYGPPGVPLFLAVARNSAIEQPGPQGGMYDDMAGDGSAPITEIWLSGGMGGPVDGQYLAVPGDADNDGSGAMSMLPADSTMMFPPPPPPQAPPGTSANAPPPAAVAHPPTQFMPTQHGIFMDGYAPPQYADARAPGSAEAAAAYMQQQHTGFG